MSTNDEKTTNKNLTFELPIKNLPIALEYYVKYPYELMQKAEEEAKKKAAELEAKIASMTPGERKEYDKEQAKIASMTPEERKEYHKEQAQQAAGQSNTEENNEGEFSKLVLRF